ncbi:MAG: FkbM family methyltransferase [Francisellaceae bacterium]|nr:FkbM family methyltransferase [Francisellaceae bacterium]
MVKHRSIKLNPFQRLCLLLTLLISLICFFLYYNQQIRIQHCPKSREQGNRYFYSQHLEDYILSMVFKDIQHGHYIDVGAYDPILDSVTHFFYLKGWRGINIEPIEEYYNNFKQYRKEDINLKMGISNQEGFLTFYQINASGLSTFDKAIAKKSQGQGLTLTKINKIPVSTLTAILKKHHLNPIHFLKIDVEGFEKNVLEGLDLTRYRPQVIVIEAVEPLTINPSFNSWEKLLLNHNYEFVIFDGLNRYYIAQENIHLHPTFTDACLCVNHLPKTKIKGIDKIFINTKLINQWQNEL